MIAPTLTTALVMSFILGNFPEIKLTSTMTGTLSSVPVTVCQDDSTYNVVSTATSTTLILSTNSFTVSLPITDPTISTYSIDPEFQIVYESMRYNVFQRADQRFFQYLTQVYPTVSTAKPIRTIKVATSRSLCGSFMIPIYLSRVFPTTTAAKLNKYTSYILEEVTNVLLSTAHSGDAVGVELQDHIDILLIAMGSMIANPTQTISAIYSKPAPSIQGTKAADACVLAVNAFKKK